MRKLVDRVHSRFDLATSKRPNCLGYHLAGCSEGRHLVLKTRRGEDKVLTCKSCLNIPDLWQYPV